MWANSKRGVTVYKSREAGKTTGNNNHVYSIYRLYAVENVYIVYVF